MKRTLAPKVHPINPHSQRLLAAEARAAKGVPAPKAKGKSEKKPAANKPKKPKKTTAGDKKNTEGEKDDSNSIAPSRTEYSEAKKKWIAEILDSI